MENNFLGKYFIGGDDVELEQLLKECLQEIEEKCNFGFNICKNLTIKWGHTEGRLLGQVHYDERKYGFNYWGIRELESIDKATITIFDHKGRNTKGIKETIIHELIHTIVGCQDHRSNFKWYCERIYDCLGYSCWSGQHDDVQSQDYLANFKHFLICENCHQIVKKGNKLTRPFKEYNHYHCAKCKTHINYMTLEEVKGWL